MHDTIDPIVAARAALGVVVRRNRGAAAEAAARSNLNTAKLERAIREALADPNPPTDEQQAALAALLSGGAR